MEYGFSLTSDHLVSSIPTQLGNMDKMRSDFWLGSNFLSSTIPTQLGQLVQMSSVFYLEYNFFSSAIPTELGQLDQMTSGFYLSENWLSAAIPTQLGKLVQMTQYFMGEWGGGGIQRLQPISTLSKPCQPASNSSARPYPTHPPVDVNSLTGAIPTELGRLHKITEGFFLRSNLLCSDIPTQVEALSAGMAEWWVATGNLIGSKCPVDTGGDDEVRFDGDQAGFSSLTTSMAVAITLVSMAVLVALVALRYRLLRARRCNCLTALSNGWGAAQALGGTDESMYASEYSNGYVELMVGQWDETATISDDGTYDTRISEQLDPLYVDHAYQPHQKPPSTPFPYTD